jgi:hypothetical protein
MTLGRIIARLHDDAFVEETVAGLDDLMLLARLQQAADAAQVSLGTVASAVVGHFVQHADGEKWLALMTAASREHDPAAASLRRMLLDGLADEDSSDQHRIPSEHGAH